MNLKETVATLQADILLIKQRQVASENIRKQDNEQMKSSVTDLKTNLNEKHETISEIVNNLMARMDSLSDSMKSSIDHRSLVIMNSSSIKILKDRMLNLQMQIGQFNASLQQQIPTLQTGCYTATRASGTGTETESQNVVAETFSGESVTSEETSFKKPAHRAFQWYSSEPCNYSRRHSNTH